MSESAGWQTGSGGTGHRCQQSCPRSEAIYGAAVGGRAIHALEAMVLNEGGLRVSLRNESWWVVVGDKLLEEAAQDLRPELILLSTVQSC
jgi:hypothetical protein